MKIQKVVQSFFVFFLLMMSMQANANITVFADNKAAAAGETVTVPIKIVSDSAQSVRGLNLQLEFDDTVLTPNISAIKSAMSGWTVTVPTDLPPSPDASVSAVVMSIMIYPEVSDTALDLVASTAVKLTEIEFTLADDRAVKSSELFFDWETSHVELSNTHDHVFINYHDAVVKMTDWAPVYQNGAITLTASKLSDKVFFQQYTDDYQQSYARLWTFNSDLSGVRQEFQGENTGPQHTKPFKWSIDSQGSLNIVGDGIDWTRQFALLPAVSVNQLPLYGGLKASDGTDKPLLHAIDRDFTLSVTGDIPKIMQFWDDDDAGKNEVILLEKDGLGRFGDTTGDQGKFSWEIGTQGIDKGAIKVTENELGGTQVYTETFHVLADSSSDEMRMVSINKDGYELSEMDLLTQQAFVVVDDLLNQAWDIQGETTKLMFHDVTDSQKINGLTTYRGEEKQSHSAIPFRWAVDANGVLFVESDTFSSIERVVKVAGSGPNGFLEVVVLDDPKGVERLIRGFTAHSVDEASLWLSRDESGDDGSQQTKRLTLNVGGLSGGNVGSLNISLSYDCTAGSLLKVDGATHTGSCADGSDTISRAFSPAKGDGKLLDLDFSINANLLYVGIDTSTNTPIAVDSTGTAIEFIRVEGAEIVGKSLMLVAEISAEKNGVVETVTVAAPQDWFDPATNQLKLPSDFAKFEGLLRAVTDKGYEDTSLGGTADYEGQGFRIRFAVYQDDGDFVKGGGDTFEYSLSSELVRINESYMDPYKNEFFAQGWYKADGYGMELLTDGQAIAPEDAQQTQGGEAVQKGQLVMVDLIEFTGDDGKPAGKSQPLTGATFDPYTNAVTIPSVSQLDTFWTSLQYSADKIKVPVPGTTTTVDVDEIVLPPDGDASSTGRGYVFMLQVFEGVMDATGTVTLGNNPEPIFLGEMELVKMTKDGKIDDVTYSTGNYSIAFSNNGWYIHTYNDDIDQDILSPVVGGELVYARKFEDNHSGAGFGGEDTPQLNSNAKFVLAQMDFANNALGTQFAITATLQSTASGEQMVVLPLESELPGTASDTFIAMTAMQFDPQDPKGGKGILFKLLGFEDSTDSTSPTGDGIYQSGETVVEMGGMVAYVTEKARSPNGDQILDPGWYVVTYSHSGDEVTPYADKVGDQMFLAHYVEMGKMHGGVGKDQEGGCEQTNDDRCVEIGTITGKIVDGQGNGIGNLWINFEPEDWESAEWGGTNTKSDGTFSIKLSGGQKYRLWIDTFGAQGGYLGGYYNGSAGITEQWDRAAMVQATGLGNAVGNISLTKGTTVTISVLDGAGEPIENLWVNMEPEGEGNWAGANTDHNGAAVLGVMNGNYRIWVDTYNTGGQYISGFYNAGTGSVIGDWGKASIVKVTGDKSIQISLARGITLTGMVLDSNSQPIGDAGINVRSKGQQSSTDSDDYFGWNDPFAGGFQGWTQTSCEGDTSKPWCNNMQGLSKGQFSVTVEPHQEYMVEVHTPDGIGGAFVYTAANSTIVDLVDTTDTIEGGLTRDWDHDNQIPVYDPIQVKDESVNIAIKLKAGVTISGEIRDNSGNLLKHAWVDFNSDQGGWGGAGTGESGAYSVQLESGKSYRMNVWPSWDDEQNGIMGGQVKLGSGELQAGDTDATGTVTQNWDQATLIALGNDSLTIDVATVAVGNKITGKVITNNADYCYDGGILKSGLTSYGDGYCGMQNVHVNVWSEDGAGGRGEPTSANGTYSINVQQGTGYVVDVWTPNGMNAYYGGSKGTVFSRNEAVRLEMASSDLTGVDFKLKKSNSISGYVHKDDGTAVRWMWVNAISKSKDRYMGASTDRNGFYRMELPSADDYIIEVWGGDRGFTTSYYSRGGSVTDERQATRLDLTTQSHKGIDVTLSSGKSISGVIRGLGSGERLWINAWSERKGNGSGTEVIGQDGVDSSFTIKGLGAADDYQLDWWHNKYASGFYSKDADADNDTFTEPVDWHERSKLDTTAGDISNIKIEMVTGGSLAGSVTGLQQGDKIYINLWSESGKGFGWQEVIGDANTATADSFRMDGLKASDDYILDLHPDWDNTGTYKGGFYHTDGTQATLSHWEDKSQITIVSDATETLLPVSLASSAGKISGEISGLETGDRAWVDAWSEKSGSWAGEEITGTDATETFTLKGLDAADDYHISIWVDGKAGGFYVGTGQGLTNFWEDATDVVVTANSETSGVVLAIESGVTLSGTISGLASGDFAWVDAFDEGLMFGNGTGINGDGESKTFTIEGLKANGLSQYNNKARGYRVMLDAHGYPTQFWNSDGSDTTWENATPLKMSADSTDQVSFTITEGNSITGTVTGFDRDEWVFIDAWSRGSGSMGFANIEKGNITHCDASDSNCTASYTISGLAPASDYIVGADRDGMRLFHDSNTADGSATSPELAQEVDISAGDKANVDLSFDIPSYTLTLTVGGVDSSDSQVYLNAWAPQGGFGWSKHEGNGVATISNLPAGDYYISAWTDGKPELYYDDTSDTVKRYDQADKLTVDGNKALSFVWLTETTYTISGKVTSDSAGTAAIAGQLVSAYSDKMSVYQSTITDSAGNFEFKAMAPADDYIVDAWTAAGHLEKTSVNISSGNQTIVLKPAASGTHDLTVDAGNGIKILGLFKDGKFVKAGVTAADATYTFKGLTDNGSYLIKVDADMDGDYTDDSTEKAHTNTDTTLSIP